MEWTLKKLKAATVRGTRLVNGEYERFKLAVGDKIMHGHYGVLEVTGIEQFDNKKWTRTVYMRTNSGNNYGFKFDTNLNGIVSNFLFAVK